MTACVKKPKPRSHGETACKTLYRFPHLTMDEAISIHGQLGAIRSDTTHVYCMAIRGGFILENGYKYSLAPYLRDYIGNLLDEDEGSIPAKADLVKPRYIPKTNEMKPVKRDPRLREISFIAIGG